MRAVVLVEGTSDARAVEVVARRLGRDLDAEGVAVVPMLGVTNTRAYVQRYAHLRLAGLYDAPEEAAVLRAFGGPAAPRTRADLEARGFYACVEDLEDELIRALGPGTVTDVVAAHGDLDQLRLLQQQPAQRHRTVEQHLHRFLGVRAGRKTLYAGHLAEALPLADVPEPLLRVLSRV